MHGHMSGQCPDMSLTAVWLLAEMIRFRLSLDLRFVAASILLSWNRDCMRYVIYYTSYY